MGNRIKRIVSRMKHAAIGAAVGAALGAIVSRNAASTAAGLGALVGATIGEKRVDVGDAIADVKNKRQGSDSE